MNFMGMEHFIIKTENDLYSFGIQKIISDNFSDYKLLSISAESSLMDYLQQQTDSVFIIVTDNMDSLKLSSLLSITEGFPLSRWLFLSSIPDDTIIDYISTKHKSINYALLSDTYDTLLLAIKNTFNRRSFYSSDVLKITISDRHAKKISIITEFGVTKTEKELIQLLAMGKTAKEIAESRNLSLHTVNTHRKNIFRKLHVKSVQELIRVAIKHQLVDLTEYYI